MNNLVYILLNFNSKYYIAMFQIFIRSILLFSGTRFDLLIITDIATHSSILELKEIKELETKLNIYLIILPVDKDLHHSLLRKCDIVKFPNFLKYKKIMYIDCDVIVQDDINNLFTSIKAKPNILYAPEEGSLDGKYWTLDKYTDEDYIILKKRNIKSFNSGTFIFIPSLKMKEDFINVKRLGLSYRSKHFYDQSFLNYYFNINGSSSTKYISDHVIIFPDVNKYYPSKTLLHFAGIGRYKEKTKIMKKYLNMLIKNNKI